MIKIYLSKLNTELSEEITSDLLKLVSEESREKFYKFHFLEDSLRSLYGEIIVRNFVSQHFKIKNEEIHILKNKYGKPYIENVPVHFNISHSGSWIACGISDQNIGIDIEKMKETNLGIAKRFFCDKEYELLISKKEEDRMELFYLLWTLKESYIKWMGTGLSTGLDTFCFHISDNKITVTDDSFTERPHFKNYGIEEYQLSVCSDSANLPDEVEIIELEQLSMNSLGHCYD